MPVRGDVVLPKRLDAAVQAAAYFVVSEAAVRKHVGNIFAKLDLPGGTDRRVSTVLVYLRGS
ncbi:hypothetical protein [Nocardioides pocheonensis]|uniref:hypothetical protein n=1 Tax=Nocardioides pocheonensis TaxID=661485 RepID=UPI00268C8B85